MSQKKTKIDKEVESEAKSEIDTNSNIGSIRKLIARLVLTLGLLIGFFFRCELDVVTYSKSMLVIVIAEGFAIFYLIRSVESGRNGNAGEIWSAVREAQEQLNATLRARGLGGDTPSILDRSSSISQALGSIFALLILLSLALVFTAGRLLEPAQECNSLDIKQWGLYAMEFIVWSLAVASGIFTVSNRGLK